MSTTKMSVGMAFNPQKELKVFSAMAAQGKQLNGVAAFGHGWSFADAPPEQVIFDLAYEAHPSQDYFDLFIATGWTPVLSVGYMHIFKAAPGTPPVHTAVDSRRDELIDQRKRFLRYSATALAFLLLVGLLLLVVSWNVWIESLLLFLALIPVVYTVMPLLGFISHLRRYP